MTARAILLAGLAAGALLPFAPASAQTTPAGPPITYGAPIPGFCAFSRDAIIANSKVGQAVIARLKVLASQVNAELQPQADAINTEKHTLETQASTLDHATLDARNANLELRYQNFERLNQQRQAEMQATEQKQISVVLQQAEPILQQLFQSKQCSVLVERGQGGVFAINPAMDLSGQAVASLDAKIQTLTFDREHIDPNAAQQPAGH